MKNENIKCKFSIVNVEDKDKTMDGIDYNVRKSYDEVLNEIQSCECILEILQQGQSGVTLRYYEAISYPGTTAEAAAFCGMAMNDDLVYLVQQRDGQYRVLGNDMFNTVTKPKGSTGEGASTNGGTDLEIEVTDLYPAPFYSGKIETDDGTINETK